MVYGLCMLKAVRRVKAYGIVGVVIVIVIIVIISYRLLLSLFSTLL